MAGQRGGGRAGVGERDLISGEPNRSEVGRDMGRWCVLPREALLTYGVAASQKERRSSWNRPGFLE